MKQIIISLLIIFSVTAIYASSDTVNVKDFGALGNDTADDTKAIQEAIDNGGAVFFPEGTYIISSPLEIRHNRKLSIFGPMHNRSLATIKTSGDFTGRSMIRQWSGSWYETGESEDTPPANLAGYQKDSIDHINRIDRYVNIRYLSFNIQSDLGGEITCLDFLSLQETSKWEGLVFSGADDVKKGWPVRIRPNSSTGKEISCNGFAIDGVTVYGRNWTGELKIEGAGSDVDIENWVTAPSEHVEPPFQLNLIDVTMRNIHCEAYSPGKPTVLNRGTDISISQSFFVIRDGQGDLFKSVNPEGSGHSRSGFSLSSIRIYPAGGAWSSVTNRNSIKLVNDTSKATRNIVPLVHKNMDPLTYIYTHSRGSLKASDGSERVLNKTGSSANLILPKPAINKSTNSLEIPYCLNNKYRDHSAIVTLTGRTENWEAALLRIWIAQTKGSKRPQTSAVLKNVNWPGDISLTYSNGFFSVNTTDETGIDSIRASAEGPMDFNAIQTN